jgi:hypothetical protein
MELRRLQEESDLAAARDLFGIDGIESEAADKITVEDVLAAGVVCFYLTFFRVSFTVTNLFCKHSHIYIALAANERRR